MGSVPITPRAETLMATLDKTQDAVSTLTGIKQQFIEAGWSDLAAEYMTLEMFRQGK